MRVSDRDVMLRRFLMRRAYNQRKWEQARKIAEKMLDVPKEQQLARSIIIRSYYNQGKFKKVIDLNSEWDGEFQKLVDRIGNSATRSEGQKEKIYKHHNNQPKPLVSIEFNHDNLSNNFHQEEDRLWMRHPKGWTFWDMPRGYCLDETHPDLLRLTCEILLYPWYPSTKKTLDKTRKKGKEISLSFSAGIDSTAAAMIMPQTTILGYHRRSFKTILDHRNAQKLLAHMGNKKRIIIDVTSNHELIRTYHEKQVGFSSDFATATHLILLADFLNIGAIAFGTPIDNTYLWKGRKYRNFSKSNYYKNWTQRFSEAGIDLLFPLAPISEGGALKIVQQAPFVDLVNSCLRGNGAKGCGICWKCFHKNGPLGRDYDFWSNEIQAFLQREFIPTTTHVLWAVQKMNISEQVPYLKKFLEEDFSWWVDYYPPAFDIIKQPYKDGILKKTKQYLAPMKEPYQLEKINHYEE